MKEILVLLSFLLLLGCVKESDLCHKTIIVHNTGDRDIYVQRSFEYPDTTDYNLEWLKQLYSTRVVPSFTSNQRVLYTSANGACWETLIRSKDYTKKDTLMRVHLRSVIKRDCYYNGMI